MWLSSEGFQQRRYKAGFADAGLAGKQNYLALAGLGPRPASQEQVKLFFSSDECGQAAGMHRLEAAFHRSRS